MSTRHISLFAILTLFLCLAEQASAQSKMAKTLLNGWDRNKDGLLEKSEIPEVAREKVLELAKRNGLDLGKALPIQKLLAKPGVKPRIKEVPAEKKASFKSGKITSSDSLRTRGEKLTKKDKSSESKDVVPEAEPTPHASAFGSARPHQVKTTGFGTNKRLPASSAQTLPEEANDDAENKKDAASQRRLRFLAKSMLAQHDDNKNGKLEKQEWSRIRGNPGASDHNRDGVLTSEELEQHLGGFASREKKDRRNLSKPKSSSRSKEATSRKTYRFLTAHERLPQGLPTWFTDRDENRDGQLTLREYASSLSLAKLDQFRAFDLNDDGFLVPSEYLKSIE